MASELKLAITPACYPEARLTDEQVEQLRSSLDSAIDEIEASAYAPRFLDN